MSGTERTLHVMMQRTAFLQRNAYHGLFRPLSRLTDRFWYFTGLSGAVTNPTLLITHNDQRSKREPASALYDFCHAVNCNQFVYQVIAAVPVALPTASSAAVP